MLQPRNAVAKDGDTVLLYRGYLNVTPLQLKAGAVLRLREGVFAHDDIIGSTLGRYVRGRSLSKADTTSTPSILVLQNSADLWTQAVPHRTQIIYDTDIAVITFNLRLGPGKRVVEAGTGSGSLTHALARIVAPSGHVFTCDFHRVRCREARRELRRNGLGAQLVSCHWRDVCRTDTQSTTALDVTDSFSDDEDDEELTRRKKDAKPGDATDGAEASAAEPECGFGLPAASVDAVFLDVPAPWAAIDNVRHVLRENGMLCTFSPCIEQTQRTVDQLRAAPHEFIDIRTVEALSRYYEPTFKHARGAGTVDRLRFRPSLVSKGHSAYLTFARRRLAPRDDVAAGDAMTSNDE